MSEDEHPELQRLLKLLAGADFATRYYAYCAAHATEGPDIPVAKQKAAIGATERAFKYDSREKFFSWRDPQPPAGCKLGLNISLDVGQAEWILHFATPQGHLGSTLAMLALQVKRLDNPGYKHAPPYPVPNIARSAELTVVLAEGLALYDEVADQLRAEVWCAGAMKQLMRVGFYKELRHGRPDGGSVRDSLQATPGPDDKRLVAYLRAGTPLVVAAGIVRDVLDNTVIGGLEIRTDGTYAWPSDFPHYVEKHQARPPGELLEHARSHGFACPSGIDLSQLQLPED